VPRRVIARLSPLVAFPSPGAHPAPLSCPTRRSSDLGGAVLVEIGDLQVGAGADLARVRRQLAQQQLEQGGLAAAVGADQADAVRSEEHTSELQSRENLVCRLLLEKKTPESTITGFNK